MYKIFFITACVILFFSCASQSKKITTNSSSIQNDTIKIANEDLDYEIIIIDSGFNSFINTRAKPRNFYSLNYLKSRNVVWVNQWNNNVISSSKNRDLYQMTINYEESIDYGYEVNYLLFNYLTYFQLKNNVRLGSFEPRL